MLGNRFEKPTLRSLPDCLNSRFDPSTFIGSRPKAVSMKAKRLPFNQRFRDRLPIVLLKLGLVVEHFELTRPTRHEKVDDAFQPWGGKCGGLLGHWFTRRSWRAEQVAVAQKLGQRDLTESHGRRGRKNCRRVSNNNFRSSGVMIVL